MGIDSNMILPWSELWKPWEIYGFPAIRMVVIPIVTWMIDILQFHRTVILTIGLLTFYLAPKLNYLAPKLPYLSMLYTSSTLSPGSRNQTTLPSVLCRVQIVQFNTTGRVVQGVESQETIAC